MLTPLGMNALGQLTIANAPADGRFYTPDDEAAFTLLQLTQTSHEARITALETWRANKANKVALPTDAVTTTSINVAGIGLALSMASGQSMRAAIEELQAWAANISANVLIARELMKAT